MIMPIPGAAVKEGRRRKLNVRQALDQVDGRATGGSVQQDTGNVHCGLWDRGAVRNTSGGGPGFGFPLDREYHQGYDHRSFADVGGERFGA